MKLLKAKKIGIIAASLAVGASATAAAIVIPLTMNKHVKDKKADPNLFVIENGELKGFKPEVTKEQIAEYTSDGVLRLPAAKVITADAFNATFGADAPFGSTIQIDDSTTEIGERAFYGNAASSITWTGSAATSNLKTIGNSAFAFCKNLTSFEFPSDMFAEGSSIGKGAFFACTSLAEFDCTHYDPEDEFVYSGWSRNAFGANQSSGKIIFSGNESSSEAYKSNFSKVWTRLAYSGVNPNWTENWNDSGKTPWTTQVKCAPDEYLTFGETAKTSWTGINTSLWPSTVTYFNAVNLPSTVTTINLPDDWTWRSEVTSWGLQNTTVASIPANFMKQATLGAGVKVLLPSTVTTIGADAFNGCTATVTLHANTALTSVGDRAFNDYTGLTSVKFGSGLTTIGTSAFEDCTGLTSIDFSALSSTTGVTINSDAFKGTGSTTTPANFTLTIKDVSTTSTIDQLQLENSFKTLLSGSGITVGKASGNNWTFAPATAATIATLLNIENNVVKGWAKNSGGTELTSSEISTIFTDRNLGSALVIPATVTGIDANAFYADSTSKIPSCITEIKFADSAVCSSIGANAFQNATSITKITIPTCVTSIGNSAFNGCSSLATIDLSAYDSVPTWGGTTIFANLPTTGTVNIQQISNQVDQWRFNKQIKAYLTDLTFETGKWTFDHEDTATLLAVSNNAVTGFSSGATTALTDAEKLALANEKNGSAKIIIPASATSIADGAFYDSTTAGSSIPSTLPTVEFASSSTCATIGKRAFYKAPVITLTLTNAAALTTIDEHAFSGSSLTTLSVPSTVTAINTGAFYECASLTSVTFNTLTNALTLGAASFALCENLSTIILTNCSAVPAWSFDQESGSDAYVFVGCASSGTIKVADTTISESLLTYFNGVNLSNNGMLSWTVTAIS